MSDFLELIVDKFIFKIAAERLYTAEGLWAYAEGDTVRVGVSDFLQQRSGDVAFAEVAAPGARLAAGDELATLETIKVTLALGAPVSGTVLAVNPAMRAAPETINIDPYGAGWLAVLAPDDWPADRTRLLDAHAYLAQVRREAGVAAQ
jgi:glycine cleavage system H protein